MRDRLASMYSLPSCRIRGLVVNLGSMLTNMIGTGLQDITQERRVVFCLLLYTLELS